MVSGTDGSPANTGWKRRARAASFSMCLRYSSSVVAPTQRSSPRANAGLSMLLASIDPSAAPAPTSVCSSSMNRMISPLAASISWSTAFSRSSNSPRYFEPATIAPRSSARKLLVLQPFGHIPLNDAVRDAFGNRGLAHAGLSDQHRIVLRPPGQHLHHATDLLVASDDRVGLALSRRLGEVARVLFERLELALRVWVGHALASADLLDGVEQPVPMDPLRLQQLGELLVGVCRQEHVLRRGVLVFERLGFLPRLAQNLAKARRQVRLRPAGYFRHAVEHRAESPDEPLEIGARLLENRWTETTRLAQELQQHVLRINLRIASIGCVLLGRNQCLACLGGQSVESHFSPK